MENSKVVLTWSILQNRVIFGRTKRNHFSYIELDEIDEVISELRNIQQEAKDELGLDEMYNKMY